MPWTGVGNKAAKDLIAAIKIVAPRMAQAVADRAMQVHGAGGFSSDFPLATIFTTARYLRMADGPDEAHMSQLAKLVLARCAGQGLMSLTLLSVPPERRGDMALADERVELSWTELDPVLDRAANAMSAAVDGKRRVAVFAPNSAEAVIAYVAGIEGGVSTVPVSYHLTPGEAAYILKDSGASVLLVGPETVEAGLAAAADAGVALVVGWRCPSLLPSPAGRSWR